MTTEANSARQPGSYYIVNGTVLAGDPAVAVEGAAISVVNGRITDVGPDAAAPAGAQVIDAGGKLVLPGLVDPHVHACVSTDPSGYYMMVAAGMTTTLEAMVGDPGVAAQVFAKTPFGMTYATMFLLMPGNTLSGNNPTRDELERVMEKAMADGAFGVKIAGAHYPLTPEATALAIQVAAEHGIPLQFHAGSTTARDDLKGMREALDCAAGNPFLLAHVNVYCGGGTLGDQRTEAMEALKWLKEAPRVVSETTLSPLSCMSTQFIDGGRPRSLCMTDILNRLGVSPDYNGFEEAIRTGKLMVSAPVGKVYDFVDIPAGLERCHQYHGDNVTIGYPRHDMLKNAMLATGRRPDGQYVVTALSTDGGIVPRNVVLSQGLKLVEAGIMTMPEFVQRSARGGARLLGLENKGVLAPGFDADIIVVDAAARRPSHVIANGHLVYRQGEFIPAPGRIHSLRPACPGGFATTGCRPYWLE